MSFSVVHMQKIKSAGIKGMQFHNQRERESRTNEDIDKEKSQLNYDLKNVKDIDFNKRVNEIIKDEVITTRAIRKDAVKMCNFLVTSDKSFFDGISNQEQKNFFKESYDFFKDRYGNNKIVAAVIHLDEKTPHMHLSLVPVNEDKKLSAKRMFDRKELRSIQDDYPKYIQSKGFNLERGKDAEGKNKHVELQRFKALTAEKEVLIHEKRLELIKAKDKEGMEQLGKLKSRFDSTKEESNLAKKQLEELRKLQEQTQARVKEMQALEQELIHIRVHSMNVDQIQIKETGLIRKKILIDKADFEQIKDLAKHDILTKDRNKTLEKNIGSYKEKYEEMYNRYDNAISRAREKELVINRLNKTIKNQNKHFQIVDDFLEATGKLSSFIDFRKNALERVAKTVQKSFGMER